MKKFVSILIIICLVFGAAITYTGCGANNAAEPETSPEPSVEPSESVDDTETETASVPQLDFEALYASHDADEVVMTMDGEEVTWEEYFYWLYYSGVQVNNYINQMAANMSAYGMNVTWDDAADDTGISFKDYVVQLAEENIRQIHSIKKFSAENDVTLTEDNLKAIEEQRMDIYRRIALIRTEEEADDLTDELIDRFGDPPPGVNALIHVALLRGEAGKAGVTDISQKQGYLKFTLRDFDMEKLSALYARPEYKGRLRVEAGSKPCVSLRIKAKGRVIDEARAFVREWGAEKAE